MVVASFGQQDYENKKQFVVCNETAIENVAHGASVLIRTLLKKNITK